MDVELFRLMAGSFGGAGVAIASAWLMFKSYRQEVDRFHQAQNERIQALESSAKKCDDDRVELHREIRMLQAGVLKENAEAFKELKRAVLIRCESANCPIAQREKPA